MILCVSYFVDVCAACPRLCVRTNFIFLRLPREPEEGEEKNQRQHIMCKARERKTEKHHKLLNFRVNFILYSASSHTPQSRAVLLLLQPVSFFRFIFGVPRIQA